MHDTFFEKGHRRFFYGFNGKEKIDEQYDIEGTAYDFGARLYDSCLGRWMAVDPLEKYFAHLSPYSAMTNNPIDFIDKNGEYFTGSARTVKEIYHFVSILAAKGDKKAEAFKIMLEEMDASDIEYNMQVPHKMSQTQDEGGFVSFDVASNRVDVVIYEYYPSIYAEGHSFKNRVIHELTHGFQFLKGKLDFIKSIDGTVIGGRSYDMTDEKEAFENGRIATDNDRWGMSKAEADKLEQTLLGQYKGRFYSGNEETTDAPKTTEYEKRALIIPQQKQYISVFNYIPTEKQQAEKNKF